MSSLAKIAKITVTLLLVAAAGPVLAASNANALLGASEPVVLELADASLATQSRPSQIIATPGLGVSSTRVTAKRLPDQEPAGFDWSTLVSLSFGVVGLLWVRRRTADL